MYIGRHTQVYVHAYKYVFMYVGSHYRAYMSMCIHKYTY